MGQLRAPRSSLLKQGQHLKRAQPKKRGKSDPDPNASPIGSSDEAESQINHDLESPSKSHSDVRNEDDQIGSPARKPVQDIPLPANNNAAPRNRKSNRKSRRIMAEQHGSKPSGNAIESHNLPNSSPSNGLKRKREETDDVPGWLRSSASGCSLRCSSQPSRTYGQKHTIHNIHAEPEASCNEQRGEPRSKTQPKSNKPIFKSLPLSEITASNKTNFKVPGGTQDSSVQSQSPLSSIRSSAAAFKSTPPSSFSDPSDSTSLSPALSDDELDMLAEDVKMTSNELRCPQCKAVVPQALLGRLNTSRSLSWKVRSDFCASHTRVVAETEWEEKGFPRIDWDGFDKRLKRFHDDLDAILDLKRPSFYRGELDRRVEDGKSRNDFRNPAAACQTVPGYYGLRGSQRMQSHLIENFSNKLRDLATIDKLIPATGIAGYVQAVLVPELAVMLVKEDLHVGTARAREVLRDSAALGILINAEERERVARRSARPRSR